MGFRKHIRLPGYDYSSDGAYFVTICTTGKRKLISDVYRRVIKKELLKIPQRFPGVKVDFFVFMPNHCHVVLIFHKVKVTLSRVLQAYKSITTLQLKRLGYPGSYFWQRNYYERVIRNEDEYETIREYIKYNPGKARIERTQ